MIPGPYSLCHATPLPDSEGVNYKTLKFGYNSAQEARNARAALAVESQIPQEEIVVICQVEDDVT